MSRKLTNFVLSKNKTYKTYNIMELKQNNHIMVDIETLSTAKNAAILQIAMQQFCPATGQLFESINVKFDAEEVFNDTRFDKSYSTTIEFWHQKMNSAVRNQVWNEGERHHMSQGLQLIYNFVRSIPQAKVWGNGPAFDLAIIVNAFETFSYPLPWVYYNERCVRTITNIDRDYAKSIQFEGLQHDALDDCKHQIKMISAIVNKYVKL